MDELRGAKGQCLYCDRYSRDVRCLLDDYLCDCGKKNGFSGSFTIPNKNSWWCKEYYIVSTKHMGKTDKAVLFWGKNSSGYYYALKDAGKYSKHYKQNHEGSDSTIFVECSVVDKLAVTMVIDNCYLGLICPHTTKSRKLIGFKLSQIKRKESGWSNAFKPPEVFIEFHKETVKLYNDCAEYLLENIKKNIKKKGS